MQKTMLKRLSCFGTLFALQSGTFSAKSPTRQINASTKIFPFAHFFAASVLHRDPAYSILELFSVLNPIWSLVYPMILKDRSIFYLDKKCCSLICSRILVHELQGGVISTFSRFLKTCTFLLICYIFRNSIPKNRQFRPRARQSFHFLKIAGT